MRRLLGALSFIGAMLLVVSSANANVMDINLSLGSRSFAGSDQYNSGATGTLPQAWTINLSGFSNPLIINLSYSTQGALTSLDASLCTTMDCTGGTVYGSVNASGSPIVGAVLSALVDPTPTPIYLLFEPGVNLTNKVWSYSFSGDAIVPVPAAALLFASGLGFLGFAGRKSRIKDRVQS